MLSIRQDQEENQNVAQAPTLGRTAGSISQGGGGGQRRNVSQRGSGFTNLQQYVTANENNANPELVRQRTAQAGTGLQQAQTGFENVAQQARTGLQGIQGVNTFVGNVLRDPTAAAADKANLQRFQALRTGQEAIANPTDVLQPFTQAQTGFESQREQLAGGLRRDVTGTGLQEFIRSQRANPSLATQGENVLDRFLTESTTAGKTALQQAQERAGQIQATQLPGISGEVEALRQQVEPLQFRTQQGIQSGIMAPTREEENYLANININEGKNLIANKLGRRSEDLDIELNELNRRIGKIQQTITQRDRNIAEFRARTQGQKQQDLNDLESRILADPKSMNDAWVEEERAKGKADIEDKYSNYRADLGSYEGERYINELQSSPEAKLYRDYENQVKGLSNLNRERLLKEYDPDRLARINALSQLSGLNFQDLLNRGV
jgi:hypothetical protein